jgi:hypothetical protein
MIRAFASKIGASLASLTHFCLTAAKLPSPALSTADADSVFFYVKLRTFSAFARSFGGVTRIVPFACATGICITGSRDSCSCIVLAQPCDVSFNNCVSTDNVLANWAAEGNPLSPPFSARGRLLTSRALLPSSSALNVLCELLNSKSLIFGSNSATLAAWAFAAVSTALSICSYATLSEDLPRSWLVPLPPRPLEFLSDPLASAPFRLHLFLPLYRPNRPSN